MSDQKRYYYLKLKDNFFDKPEIRAIESMENGYEYIAIMQKMYLRSLQRGGKLMLTDSIPYDIKTLAKVLGHKQETVSAAVNTFASFDLVRLMDDRSIYMLEIQNFIGESSTEADRKRDYRLQINNKIMGHLSLECPDKNPPEIRDKEIRERDNKNTICQKFEDFRKAYPGTKRGYEAEYKNFDKKNGEEVLDYLMPALKKEIEHKAKLKALGKFCPEWKNLTTWINKCCWTQELGEVGQNGASQRNFSGNRTESLHEHNARRVREIDAGII